MTPEGKVKAEIKKVLDAEGADLHYYMPVPAGYGKPHLDYIGCFFGLFFAIEAKAPGVKKPTPRQEGTMEDIDLARGVTFFINGTNNGLDLLREWLRDVRRLSTAP